MKKSLLTFTFLLGLMVVVRSQSVITGTVNSTDDSEPLPGVTVLEKGTSNGAVTDIDGNFRIEVPSSATLVFSYLGFKPQEIDVGSRSVIDVSLELDVETLNEVVVTAYGIERQADAVGYATASLKAEEFSEAKQISVMQSLAGKVAGVNITAPPTGPAGSTNILIRGMRSFDGDNRPLIVIDGVPVSNGIFDPAGKWGGRDNGDGLTSLNPDDIESIDVLKGAAAGTLYGTAAQNGVLLVTTKKGSARRGIGVEVTSNYVFDNVAVFPDFQNEYGQGVDGEAPTTQAEATTLNSWGAPINGQSVINFDGVSRPYTAFDRKDNLKKYYETGSTFTNTVALTGGDEVVNSRFSASHLNHEGIVPNSGYDRTSLNLISTARLGERVTAEVKATYSLEEALNRPNLSDNPSNPAKSLALIPANIDIDLYKDNLRDENGNAVQVFNTPFTLNPYWGPLENINSDTRNRVVGYFKMGYQLTDWLNIQGRVSIDYFNQRLDNLEELGTAHNVNGAVWNDNRTSRTESHDLLLLGSTDFADDFSIDYTAGITQYTESIEFFRSSGSQLVLRDLPNVNNTRNRNPGEYTLTEQTRNAFLANTNIGYKSFVFLDLALRQEWLSTLTNPNDLEGSENSITFGSVSGSFIFSEALALPEIISYGKLRASYGTAGGGTNPYLTSLVYNLEGATFNGASNGNVGSNNIFPNPNIKPNLTVSREVGANITFFGDRVGLDFTLYQTNTTRQIVQSELSRTTGYERALINSGEIENKGFEVLLNGSPISTADFNWDVSLNLARNRGTVLSISDELDQIQIGDNSRFAEVSIQHIVGEAPANLYGRKIQRTADGSIIHGADGLPLASEEQQILGNFNPDLIAGITNTFTYKDFSLSVLIDTKQGAQMSSLTKLFALIRGLDKETLSSRSPSSTMVAAGVNESGEPNNVRVDQQTYFSNLAQIGEKTVINASYIKVREMRLNYRLPGSVIGNSPFSSVTVGLVGRNLFFLQNDVADLGIDPEGLYNNSNSTGLEYLSLPSTRSFGINLNMKF